jgi:hypothetical protein
VVIRASRFGSCGAAEALEVSINGIVPATARTDACTTKRAFCADLRALESFVAIMFSPYIVFVLVITTFLYHKHLRKIKSE